MVGGAGGLGVHRAVRSRWVGHSAVLPGNTRAPQWLYAVLTVSMLGVQLVWSCEMGQASPYLLSLGLSKAWMSVVFLAGPLSGLIVQPLVGALSDSCKSPLGRRRPYIMAGCLASGVAVMLFGWTRDIAAIVTTRGGNAHSKLTVALAVLSVYVIDFSVNVIQAMDRSLLVDIVPAEEQPDANAWAGRMFGFGAVFAYFVGGVDLVWATGGYLGDEQLKVLTVFTTFFLFLSHGITCLCVKERVLLEQDTLEEQGLASALHGVWTTLRTIPAPVQHLFNIQFSAWIGWFPVLFFATTWVAEMHVVSLGESDLGSAPLEMREEATRLGTRAMLYHSCISFFVSVVVPPLIATADSSWAKMTRPPTERDAPWWKRRLPNIPFDWLTLPLLWTMSTIFFAVLLFTTYLARSYITATIVVALLGFCWAVTNWAPFAILGELIYAVPGDEFTSRRSSAVEEGLVSDEQSPIKSNKSDTTQHKLYTDAPYPSTPPRHRAVNRAAHANDSGASSPQTATSEYFDASPASMLPSPRHSEGGRRSIDDAFPPNNSSLSLNDGRRPSLSLGDPYQHSPYDDATPRSIAVRHSDSLDDDRSTIGDSFRRDLPSTSKQGQWLGDVEEEGDDTDDRDFETDPEPEQPSGDDHAGTILGCHNIYIVLPQLLVSAVSSIIFALFAPHHSVVDKPSMPPASNGTVPSADETTLLFVDLAKRMAEGGSGASGDAIGWVFRIGGISAAVSAWLCFRFMRRKELERSMSRIHR